MVNLSSSAYKYPRRGCRRKGGEKKKERAGEDRQAAETKKKEKPEGAKLLRNELEEEQNREGSNKFEKGDSGGLQKSRNKGESFCLRGEELGQNRRKGKRRGNRERERDRELFGEKQGDRSREKKQRQKRRGRATTAGCHDTNATRSTNTAALPMP
jgi:hypothetical protein